MTRLICGFIFSAILHGQATISGQTNLSGPVAVQGPTLPPNASRWIVPDGQWGVGNNDLDCVRSSNTFTLNGLLHLVTNQQTSFCIGGTTYAGKTQAFTSAAVVAKTFNFQYGVVKIRAKIPGIGIHGGLWMLDATCQSQQTTGDYGASCASIALGWEVDILDYLPQNFGSSTGVCGYFNTSTWTQIPYTYDPTAWHEYSVIWTAGNLVWKVDGSTVCTVASSPNVPMFPVLSTEVDNATSGRAPHYPITLLVDYERICSDPTAACLPGDPTMVFQDEFK